MILYPHAIAHFSDIIINTRKIVYWKVAWLHGHHPQYLLVMQTHAPFVPSFWMHIIWDLLTVTILILKLVWLGNLWQQQLWTSMYVHIPLCIQIIIIIIINSIQYLYMHTYHIIIIDQSYHRASNISFLQFSLSVLLTHILYRFHYCSMDIQHGFFTLWHEIDITALSIQPNNN